MTEHRLAAWGDELRRVHDRLREALQLARDSIAEGATPQHPSRDLLLFCTGFCTALDGHHRSEGAALFPRIVEARPDLAPVIDALVRDHNAIDQLTGDLQQALDSGAEAEALDRHLEGIEAVMESHFRYEERQLIAVLSAVGDGDDVDAEELFGPLAR